MEKVVELNKVTSGVGMVFEVELNEIRGEMVFLQGEKAIFESKLADRLHIEQDITLYSHPICDQLQTAQTA